MADQLEYHLKTEDENKNILRDESRTFIKQESEEEFLDYNHYINSQSTSYEYIKTESIDIKSELPEHEDGGHLIYEEQVQSEVKEGNRAESITSDEKLYHCDKCGFKSKYSGNLSKHKYCHTHIKQFCCILCSYSTNRSDNLKKHEINIHSKIQPNTNYKSKSDIIIVRESVYACQFCNFRTDYEYVLDQHMFTHDDPKNEKKYNCEQCTYQTNKKENYKIHSITHKTTNEVVKYKCPLCDHESTRKSNLRQHLVTHKSSKEVTMYKCHSCPFESKYKKSLSKHVIRHRKDAEKQWYECEICSFRTFTKYSLKPHMLLHQDASENGAYKCDYCGQSFESKKGLNYHRRKYKKKKFVCVAKSEDNELMTIEKVEIDDTFLKHELDDSYIKYEIVN